MDALQTLHHLVRRALRARGVASRLETVSGHPVHGYLLTGSGDGPPVLLVHGLGGNANGFARLFFRLARHFRAVHAIDLPGNGFSPLPDAGPLTLAEHLGVLHGYCRQVVRAPALVVGNSLGGALALSLAAHHPEDVRALGLLAPAGARLTPPRFAELMQRLEVRTAREGLTFTRRLFHRAPLTALLFSTQMPKLQNTPAVRAIRAGARAEDHLAPELLARVVVPTLLLWGGSEKLLPDEMLSYFRSHLPPSARIEVVEGVGHVPQMENPREVVRRLVAFAADAGLLAVTGEGEPGPASAPSAGSGSAPFPSRA